MAPQYSYTARDGSGRSTSGSIEADSERTVAAQLRDNGLFPVQISVGKGTAPMARPVVSAPRAPRASSTVSLDSLFSKVGIDDLAVLNRQLAVMIKSGLPILRALSILAEQAKKKVLKEALYQVSADVQGGASLTAALSRHPRVFPRMMVYMIQAAEAGGALETIVERLAVHYEKEKDLKAKISQAMMYPIVVSVVATAVVLILIYFVLPSFATLFSGIQLPPQTRFLLWLPGAMRQYGLYVLIAIVGTVAGLRAYVRSEQGSLAKDRLVLRIPILGSLVQKIATARFCRTLATLVSSGITVLAALELVQNVVTNKVMSRGLASVQEAIRQGSGLSGPLEAARIFPTMVNQMVRVGEETGGLEEVLMKVADFYESEVDGGLKTLVGLIEPAVLIVMGGIAGTIVSSIMIPMFDMMGSM